MENSMIQNGDLVLAKKTENGEFSVAGRFVGMSENNEFICENKGQFARFRYCKKAPTKKPVPMDFLEVCQLLEWHCFFKHVGSGVVVKNPSISVLENSEIVLIDGRPQTEMLYAIPEDASVCKWSRCEMIK